MSEVVEVVGLGVVSAAGSDLETFWRALLEGRAGGVERPDLAAQGIRAARVAMVRGNDGGTPPLETAIAAALADAGGVDLGRTALVVGTSAGGMVAAESTFRSLAAGEIPDAAAARAATYSAPAFAAARAAGIGGPVRVLSAACASSLYAVVLARDLLADGACDFAIAAGHDDFSLFVHAGFDALGALSRTTTRPFRAGRDGLLAGEGAGAMVLARSGTGRRARAKVLGAGLAADAKHVTAPDAEGRGLASAIERALSDAGSPVVDFVSAHGTGTPPSDVSEARALWAALGPRAAEIPVVSWKPVLGHAMGAAGVLELVGAILALERGTVPGTATSGAADPDVRLDVLDAGPRRLDAKVALKVSSGFGGANAAVVIGRA